MNYLLDSNICIHFFRGNFGMLDLLNSVGIENCAISEITLAELVFGAEKSSNPEKNHKIINSFCEKIRILPIFDAISIYGKEKARLQKNGTVISDFDLLIACTAIENNLIMVTENVKDFEKISNIIIENWIKRN